MHPRLLQGGPCIPILGGEAPRPHLRQGYPAPMDRLRSLSVRCGGSRLRKQSAEAPSCSQDGTLPILFRSWSVQVAQDKPVRHDLLMDCPQAPAAGDVGAATGPGIAFPPSRPQTPGNPLINSAVPFLGRSLGGNFRRRQHRQTRPNPRRMRGRYAPSGFLLGRVWSPPFGCRMPDCRLAPLRRSPQELARWSAFSDVAQNGPSKLAPSIFAPRRLRPSRYCFEDPG